MQLLGGRSAAAFLSQYWQKRPLLVRKAIPGFKGLVQAPELLALAERDDVESRLVSRIRGAWQLRQGPLARADIARLPQKNWTLLIQGLNLVLPEADALLRRFRFLPYARLDDVMVSHAMTGGGVGPHLDSYDVFLLQGPGRRRWEVSRPRPGRLDATAPLKILRDFRPERSWVLDPGDMLYLPPGWGHDGVAIEPCQTYSIGFRAPSDEELAREFLAYLQERIERRGSYRDPGLAPPRHAAEIPASMVRHSVALAAGIRWRARDVARFLGEYLTSPKPQVVFARPRRPAAPARFATLCEKRGLRLDLRTQLLFRGPDFFINGERAAAPARTRVALQRLADERSLPAAALSRALLALLHAWYLSGWVRIGERHERD
jgi:50S ribosomal protein L16 3-hydroxylase